jgi:hypothetical protein
MKMATAHDVDLKDLRKIIPEDTTESKSPSNVDLLKELPYHAVNQATYEDLLK